MIDFQVSYRNWLGFFLIILLVTFWSHCLISWESYKFINQYKLHQLNVNMKRCEKQSSTPHQLLQRFWKEQCFVRIPIGFSAVAVRKSLPTSRQFCNFYIIFWKEQAAFLRTVSYNSTVYLSLEFFAPKYSAPPWSRSHDKRSKTVQTYRWLIATCMPCNLPIWHTTLSNLAEYIW